MTQTVLDPATSVTLAQFDTMYTQLYNWRELVSTPSYGAATPKYDATTGGWILLGGGGLGYGPGSGGTVTQATSKATAVTLNKASGTITTNAASLAAGATVLFNCSNSVLASADTVVCHVLTATSGTQNYRTWVLAGGGGTIAFALQNISGGALAEAVTISFAVIKVSTT